MKREIVVFGTLLLLVLSTLGVSTGAGAFTPKKQQSVQPHLTMVLGCSEGKRVFADEIKLTDDGYAVWRTEGGGGIYHPMPGEVCRIQVVTLH